MSPLSQNRRSKVVHVLTAQSLGAGTVNGAAIDCTGWDEALILVNAGAHTTGTTDIKVQESDDGATDWLDIASAAFTQITSANDIDSFLGVVDLKAKSRGFIRVVTVVATAAGLIAVTAVLMGPDSQSRAGTPAFAV